MKRRPASANFSACPCGSARTYAQCCGRWHAGAPAPDAEALMRSRYCAYVMQLDAYVLATWHVSTRPASLASEEALPKWLGLEIKRFVPDGERALVEFVARCKLNGRASRLHETSRFVREDGRWYYVTGKVDAT